MLRLGFRVRVRVGISFRAFGLVRSSTEGLGLGLGYRVRVSLFRSRADG